MFPSVRSAKVIADPATGRSRGYGFVRFGDGGERDAALARMQGHILSDRAIRVSVATAKKGSVSEGDGGGGKERGRGVVMVFKKKAHLPPPLPSPL